MNYHIDPNDAKYQNAASQILARHNNNEAEANITSAVRDFFIVTGLAKAEEIVEETPPSDTSRRAVDLTALDTFVEMKRRVGTTGGNDPNPEYIGQLDDYLLQSQQSGRGRPDGDIDRREALAAALAPGPGRSRRATPTPLPWRRRTIGCRCLSGCGTGR